MLPNVHPTHTPPPPQLLVEHLAVNKKHTRRIFYLRMVVITENRREREGEKESFIKGAPKGETTRCMYVGCCHILDVLWREFYRLAVQLQTSSASETLFSKTI